MKDLELKIDNISNVQLEIVNRLFKAEKRQKTFRLNVIMSFVALALGNILFMIYILAKGF